MKNYVQFVDILRSDKDKEVDTQAALVAGVKALSADAKINMLRKYQKVTDELHKTATAHSKSEADETDTTECGAALTSDPLTFKNLVGAYAACLHALWRLRTSWKSSAWKTGRGGMVQAAPCPWPRAGHSPGPGLPKRQ